MNPRLVRAAKRLDFVWKLLARLPFSGRAPAGHADSAVSSILVIDLHLVGDMVMLLPLLGALRARFPAARISLLAGPWSAAILAGTHHVDEVIHYAAPWVKPQPVGSAVAGYLRMTRRLRAVHWDIGIDVRGDVRQILLLWLAACRRRVGFTFTGGAALLTHVVRDDGSLRHILDHHERIAESLGAWLGTPFVPRLFLTPAEQSTAAAFQPFIGFHFGASLPLRRLPPHEAARLVALNDRPDQHMVIFSSPDIEEYVEQVLSSLPAALLEKVELWKGDLRSFIIKASRATRIFAMDSGPAHISAALGRDTVVFFGPNLPAYTGPRGPHVRFLEDPSVPCRPCDQRHCINPIYQACMRALVTNWSEETQVAEPTRNRA